eukprot:jgi/Botrbrau1/11690/Bobra.0195s0021.1
MGKGRVADCIASFNRQSDGHQAVARPSGGDDSNSQVQGCTDHTECLDVVTATEIEAKEPHMPSRGATTSGVDATPFGSSPTSEDEKRHAAAKPALECEGSDCEGPSCTEVNTPATERKQAATQLNQEAEGPDCRICYMADKVENLISPCACCGSLQYAHLDCLKAWALERMAMTCEICESKYKPDIAVHFEAAVREALEQHRREGRSGVVVINIGGSPQEEVRPRSTQMHIALAGTGMVLLLLVFLYFVLYTADVAQMSPYLAIFLRLTAFLLPVYLVAHGIYRCYRNRQTAQFESYR